MNEKRKGILTGILVGITIVAAVAFVVHLIEEDSRRWDTFFECQNPPTGAKPAYVEFCSVFLRDWEEERRMERLQKFNEAVEGVR